MRWVILFAATGLMAGCQAADPSVTPYNAATVKLVAETAPVELPTTRPAVIGTISLRGDVQHAGPRDLRGGERISDILHTASFATPVNKLTVVLVRRCPEGTTSEMIDVGQNLTVLDLARNYELRDGDELVVSIAPPMPEGLTRPLASDMPATPTH